MKIKVIHDYWHLDNPFNFNDNNATENVRPTLKSIVLNNWNIMMIDRYMFALKERP